MLKIMIAIILGVVIYKITKIAFDALFLYLSLRKYDKEKVAHIEEMRKQIERNLNKNAD